MRTAGARRAKVPGRARRAKAIEGVCGCLQGVAARAGVRGARCVRAGAGGAGPFPAGQD